MSILFKDRQWFEESKMVLDEGHCKVKYHVSQTKRCDMSYRDGMHIMQPRIYHLDMEGFK